VSYEKPQPKLGENECKLISCPICIDDTFNCWRCE
jgi:hypothetical protein